MVGNVSITRQEIDSLCHLAREAGSAIMDIYRQDFSAWLKDNGSPLTEADLQADRQAVEETWHGQIILKDWRLV